MGKQWSVKQHNCWERDLWGAGDSHCRALCEQEQCCENSMHFVQLRSPDERDTPVGR